MTDHDAYGSLTSMRNTNAGRLAAARPARRAGATTSTGIRKATTKRRTNDTVR